MVKILHTGDFHLDSPFHGLDASAAAERRRGQRELLRRIVELGNAEGVSLLLLAGDLFDGKNAYYETAKEIADALSESNARVFIAPGNHDAYTADSPYRSVRFPSNVHIFKSPNIEKVRIPELNLSVYGAGFDSETCDVGMLSGFIADDESELTVMLMHGNMMGDDYNPIRESEIKDSGLTYLALGHIHAFSFVKTAGKTAYAYPGCPEGRGFDETGDKGVLLGEITKRGVDLRFKTVSEYRYAERSVDLTRVNDAIHAIAGVIPQSALKETCRLTLFGRCEPPDVESITNEFKDRFYNLIVRDRTVRSRDIWEDEGEDSLKGIFLAKLHRAYNEAVNEPEREKIRRAAEYGLAAFENHDIN